MVNTEKTKTPPPHLVVENGTRCRFSGPTAEGYDLASLSKDMPRIVRCDPCSPWCMRCVEGRAIGRGMLREGASARAAVLSQVDPAGRERVGSEGHRVAANRPAGAASL